MNKKSEAIGELHLSAFNSAHIQDVVYQTEKMIAR